MLFVIVSSRNLHSFAYILLWMFILSSYLPVSVLHDHKDECMIFVYILSGSLTLPVQSLLHRFPGFILNNFKAIVMVL